MADPIDVRSRSLHPAHRPPEVHALIDSARRHALGLDFLLRGAHDAVAATFGVHAFVVDAARDHLQAAAPQGTRGSRGNVGAV
ncbi:MAG TPA: hypothetical protein VND21_07640 [Planctomycetota bacterium]|nr:hypothetical protein [Planctomycetota bacterium]